ncbi:hypothetical protein HW932_03260 [Allochromatium humboldtianum]|uniref:Uncharacterized protein n=1 Tax=Allochromatium humboldtianum TaxID=504901 RepID=A0A850R650_9GAMM|nr:hypothetical protein [Allochromatium humboldtianum]NVZ08275.1 hypothetical protein [Allochromatium humboldtianum]
MAVLQPPDGAFTPVTDPPLSPAILMAAVAVSVTAEPLPAGFIHLQTLAPEIAQDKGAWAA